MKLTISILEDQPTEAEYLNHFYINGAHRKIVNWKLQNIAPARSFLPKIIQIPIKDFLYFSLIYR